jgi:ubiquinone biosynthesis protein
MEQIVIVLGFVIGLPLEAALVAVVARRVLGVPVGWLRSVAVGLIMIVSLGAMINFVLDTAGLGSSSAFTVAPVKVVLFVVLAAAWVFALGVAALVGLEAVVPTGTLAHTLGYVTGWGARRRRAKRYTQIIVIAVKHGLGGYLRGRAGADSYHGVAKTARSLKDALNEAGVTFIKLGQMVSTRQDLVPEAFISELSTLQTQATPEPWAQIEPAIACALGRPLDTVFSSIDPHPLASASVAQVHRARLHGGQDVVVKVQRPGARKQVTSDLEILLRLARWLNRSTPWGRSLGVFRLAQGFAASLAEELDYTVERDNMRAVAVGGADGQDTAIAIPHAYENYSSSTVLVMDKLPGIPIGDAKDLLATFSDGCRKAIAERLLNEVFRQIMVTGVFHADLHPGNIFITDDGSLGMLDFGSVGRLDDSARTALATLLLAIDRNDAIAATDALIELLDRPDELAERELERAIGQLVLRYRTGFGSSGSAGMFASLFKLVSVHRFAIPPQIAAAFRALGALEGTLRLISNDIDIVATARAQGRAIMGQALKPGNLRHSLERQLLSLLPVVQRLPRRINKITEDLEQGRLSINIRPLADPRDRRFITALVQQVVVAILAAAATLGATILLTSDMGPWLTSSVRLYAFVGYALLFGGFVLALRALVSVFKNNADRFA